MASLPSMIYNLSDPNRYLYHYTTAGTAIDRILTNRTLRLGPYSGTNDPKESKTWQFKLGGERLAEYDMDEMSRWLSRELQAKARLACFSLDSEPLTGDHVSDIFRRGFCKPRMWAQYGDRHRGVCLVFDWQKLVALCEKRFAPPAFLAKGPVTYVDRGIVRKLSEQEYLINLDHLEKVGKAAYVRDHISTHYPRLFFEKMNDWRDEAEFRCITLADTETDVYLDIGDSIVGLMFGENSNNEDIRRAMALTKGWDIDYMKLTWHNSSPWYDLGNRVFLPPPWGTRA